MPALACLALSRLQIEESKQVKVPRFCINLLSGTEKVWYWQGGHHCP